MLNRVDSHRKKIDEFNFTMGDVTGKEMPCNWDSRRPLKLEDMPRKMNQNQDMDEQEDR